MIEGPIRAQENQFKRQPNSDHDFIHEVSLAVSNFKRQIYQQLLSFRLDQIQEIDFQVNGDLFMIIHVAPDGIGMVSLKYSASELTQSTSGVSIVLAVFQLDFRFCDSASGFAIVFPVNIPRKISTR